MSPIAFDDSGSPVATVDFAYPDEPEAQEPGMLTADDAARLRRETITRFLTFLTTKAKEPGVIGRRAMLLAYVIGIAGGAKSQKELADILKISEGRVSQLLKKIRNMRGISH
jgi:hypothetical protein